LKEIEEVIAFIDALTDNLSGKYKDKVKEKLARMEITARTQKKRQKLKDIDPSSVEDLTGRYGSKHKQFFIKLLLDAAGRMKADFDDSELKMAGAVTTGSAPAMFNKVVRGRKKRRKKDE
jgi:homospermidine synthase